MDAPTVRENRRTGVWTMTLHGAVTLRDGVDAGAAIDKCLAACPAAIVVDLRHTTGFDGVTVALLPTWNRRADTAGVPLEYVAAGDMARRIRRDYPGSYVCVHRSLAAAAEAALSQPGRRWARLRLVRGSLASTSARNAVSDLCLVWNLHDLLYAARLLTAEMVDNALAHAGTDIELTAGVLDDYLHIRVRDGNETLPQPRPVGPRCPDSPLDICGTGLPLLARYATAWGSTRHEDGKTVWVTLHVPASPARASGAGTFPPRDA